MISITSVLSVMSLFGVVDASKPPTARSKTDRARPGLAPLNKAKNQPSSRTDVRPPKKCAFYPSADGEKNATKSHAGAPGPASGRKITADPQKPPGMQCMI